MNRAQVIPQLKQYFAGGATKTLSWRLQQLQALKKMLLENRAAWENALQQDLGKDSFTTWVTEISQVIGEAHHAQKNLKTWLRSKKVKTPLALQPASSSISYEPYGVALIIAPWNYPLQLLLSPLVGAIAAGNCAVLKPSELASATEKLFQQLVPQYLDQNAIQVCCGNADTVTELITAKPDIVFFTGSTRVGKIIAASCAKNLIPCILELGGKCPVYVHKDADLKVAAKRLVWAKFTNAGQTCVAPDHVYVHKKVAAKFTRLIIKNLRRAYGTNPQLHNNYSRIITTGHATRIAKLIPSTTDKSLIWGGQSDPQNRYIAPTILSNIRENHPAMQEEIFGPVLPIITVATRAAAVAKIIRRDPPLAAYIFTKKRKTARKFFSEVPAGAGVQNAALVQLASPYLPFGGINSSGTGNYHGYWSFQAFSYEKSQLSKPARPDTLALLNQPVSPLRKKILSVLLPGK